MIEINLSQIFRSWDFMEVERTVHTHLDEFEAEKIIRRIQKSIFQKQLSSDNHYFYVLRKIDIRPSIQRRRKKRSEDLWRFQLVVTAMGVITSLFIYATVHHFFKKLTQRAFYGVSLLPILGAYKWAYPISESFYPDRVPKDRNDLPFDVVLSRVKGLRECPRGFNIEEDVDPLTQEKISEEVLDSPHMIFLPSYICNSKGFIRLILMKGNVNFCDPIDKRSYTRTESQNILQQIKWIFGISNEDFLSCLDPVILELMDPDYRGVDEEGNYSPRAINVLSDAINGIDLRSLKEVGTFFCQLENRIDSIMQQLNDDASFREAFYNYVRLLKESPHQKLLDQHFPLFSPHWGPYLSNFCYPWVLLLL